MSYVEAVLNVGAKPMITFAKMHKPVNDLEAVDEFADRSGDVVRRCIEQWGGDVVRDWYWCVWNEPNNEWISGPVTFAEYRHIYEQIAGSLSALAQAAPRRAQAAHRRAGSRRISAVLDGLGVAFSQ